MVVVLNVLQGGRGEEEGVTHSIKDNNWCPLPPANLTYIVNIIWKGVKHFQLLQSEKVYENPI